MELFDVLRQEKKYVLGILEEQRMRRALSQTLTPDPHNGPEGYVVRSLYFDTPDDTDFREKSDGVELRRKIRLRIYDLKARSAKLELKEKQGDFQRKRSLPLSREEAKQIAAGDYGCLLSRAEPFAVEMYARLEDKLYRPKCIVEYDRTAWSVEENDIRVTLDRRVRATEANLSLFDKDLMLYPVCGIGETTLELKYNRFLLTYVRELMALHEKAQTSASKYCMARNISMRGTE